MSAIAIGEGSYGDQAGSVVRDVITRNRADQVNIVSITPGTYTRDTAIAPHDRFQPGGTLNTAGAVEIALSRTVPLIFGAVFGQSTGLVRAKAIAAHTDMAAFSIGTRLTNVTGNIQNQLLSSLAGTSLNLSTSEIATLTNDRIDVLGIGDALAQQAGLTDVTYSEIFDRSYSVSDVIKALGTASGSPTAAGILNTIAAQTGSSSIQLNAIVNLGSYGNTDYHDPRNPLTIDAYTMLRAALQQAQGDTYRVDLNLSAAGLSTAKVIIVGSNTTVHSPMITLDGARDLVLRTGATRIYLETTTSATVAALGRLQVPFYAELAPGEARMTGLDCQSNSRGVTLGVKPSIGSVALGQVDTSKIADFSEPLEVQKANIASSALAKVTALSNLKFGGNAERSVFFNDTEIANHTVKSVQASDVVSSLASSLVSQAEIEVQVLGLGINASSLTSLVGSVLGAVAPAIDGLLYSTLETAGVKIGASDVSVDRLSCGVPQLVG